jgi:hypothetical protein
VGGVDAGRCSILLTALDDHIGIQSPSILLCNVLYWRVSPRNFRTPAKVSIRPNRQSVPGVCGLVCADKIDERGKSKVQKTTRFLLAHTLRNSRIRFFLSVLYSGQVDVNMAVDQSRRKIKPSTIDDFDVAGMPACTPATADSYDTIVLDADADIPQWT